MRMVIPPESIPAEPPICPAWLVTMTLRSERTRVYLCSYVRQVGRGDEMVSRARLGPWLTMESPNADASWPARIG